MSVAGIWNLTINSPLGTQTARLDIQDVGGSHQGTLTGKSEPSALEGLKVDENNVSFAANADTPVGKMMLEFSGVVTGDSIAGKYSTPFGAFDFSGTRA
jgi:hypothetical protein